LEMAFSLVVIVIVAVLGVMILAGAFTISPAYKGILGVVLIGYSLIRFSMLRSRYRSRRREEESLAEPYKEQRKSFRKL
jgi:heme A synthase